MPAAETNSKNVTLLALFLPLWAWRHKREKKDLCPAEGIISTSASKQTEVSSRIAALVFISTLLNKPSEGLFAEDLLMTRGYCHNDKHISQPKPACLMGNRAPCLPCSTWNTAWEKQTNGLPLRLTARQMIWVSMASPPTLSCCHVGLRQTFIESSRSHTLFCFMDIRGLRGLLWNQAP